MTETCGESGQSAQQSLEAVLADMKSTVATLTRARAAVVDVHVLATFIERVEKSDASEFMEWLTDEQAATRTGRSKRWLRAEFTRLMALGHARIRKGRREFRAVALPQREHNAAALAAEAGAAAGAAVRSA